MKLKTILTTSLATLISCAGNIKGLEIMKNYEFENKNLEEQIINSYELTKKDPFDSYQGNLNKYLKEIDLADGWNDNKITRKGYTTFKSNQIFNTLEKTFQTYQ
jgi:hypothetical protein